MTSIVGSGNFFCFAFSEFFPDWCPVILGKAVIVGFVCSTVVLGMIFYSICVYMPSRYVESNVLLQPEGITAFPGSGWGVVYQTCSVGGLI